MAEAKQKMPRKAKKKAGKELPNIEDEHIDLMKLIYGGCGSCPSSSGCGSADLDEDGNPTDEPKTKA